MYLPFKIHANEFPHTDSVKELSIHCLCPCKDIHDADHS